MSAKWRPRLSTVLLLVNLVIVLLPVGSLLFFRIYENQLVRQTESELIAQAAVLAASYRQALLSELGDKVAGYGRGVTPGKTVRIRGEEYRPVLPSLRLTVDTPLPDRPDGRKAKAGDLAALAAGRKLTDIIVVAQKSTLAGLKILDYRGVVVAGRFEVGESFAHVEEVKRALKGKYASVVRERKVKRLPSLTSLSRGTGIRVFVAMPIVADDRLLGVAYVSRTPNSILKHLYDQRTTVVLAGLFVIAMVLFASFLTSTLIARPIKRLISRARQIKAGNIAAMTPMRRPGTQEMALLAAGFSDMATTLHERSEYIRRFAAHVSHEFKTPLTSIQGSAELLQEHYETMTGEERKRFIDNIVEDGARLQLLVTRLLELARADAITPDGGNSDVAENMKTLAGRFKPLAITSDTAVRVAMSAENFETVFANLIDNAVQHGAKRVEASWVVDGNEVVFDVRDNGEGISEANLDKIFTPFFTTRRAQGGTGLGLGIVQSIVTAHGGRVRARKSDNGAWFEVRLPIAIMD